MFIPKDICTPVFLEVLIHIGQDMETKCTGIKDWLKKVWYIYTMEYYSAVRKDETVPFLTTWMDLENIMVYEISQSEKAKNHMISFICAI